MLLVALAATVFVPSASARERFDTEIEVLDADPEGDGYYVNGLLHSEKQKCVRNRSVLLGITGVGSDVRDTDQSSQHGAWALYGNIDGATFVNIVVERKKLANGDVCKGLVSDPL